VICLLDTLYHNKYTNKCYNSHESTFVGSSVPLPSDALHFAVLSVQRLLVGNSFMADFKFKSKLMITRVLLVNNYCY